MVRVPVLQASTMALLAICALSSRTLLAADDAVTFRGSFSWLTSYRHTEPVSSVANPNNEILKIPSHVGTTELKPNLKLSSGSLQLIFRPRILAEVREVLVDEERQPSHGTTSDQISEAYGQWAVSDYVTFAYGRQNFQWGAAESLSPSNRIFHEVAQAKSVLYSVRGRDLARINISVGKAFSLVMMTELKQNDDQAPFVAEESFQSVGLIKPEVSWNNGADYFGIVIGAREHDRGWIGEYANVSLPYIDGVSLYADASHERGSQAWYPVKTIGALPTGPAALVTFDGRDREKDEIRTLAVGGIRYDFEGGTFIRAEYIVNQSAWDKDERDLALKAFDRTNVLQLPRLESNTARFMTPGFDVPGRRFAFASVTAPDALSIKDLTLYIRGTRSMTDGSTEAYGSMEYRVGEAGTILLAAGGTGGDKDTELRSYASPTEIVAYRHDW